MATKKKTTPKQKATKPRSKTTKRTTRRRAVRKPPAVATIIETAPPVPEPEEPIGDDGLTNRQRVWVDEYFRCWNKTEAARRAGYSDPEHSGYENSKKPQVKALIEQRLKQHHMSADEVLARLSDMAQGSMSDFVTREVNLETGLPEATIDLEKAQRAGKLHLLRKINIGKDGISIELYDSKGALELLGKHHKLFTEKHEHSGEVGTRISNLNELLQVAYGKPKQ